MPVLTAGTALRSRVPTVTVENKLDAGSWRFRLTVVDDAGNESDPAELVVTVVQARTPVTPVGTTTGPVLRDTGIRDTVQPTTTTVTPVRRPL